MEENNVDTSQWVDLYADYLFNYAISRVSDEELAKDLVQETFIAGLKSLSKFEHKSSVKTWLVSILKRKVIDFWRQKESRKTDTFSNFFKGEDDGHWEDRHQPKGMLASIEIDIHNEELANVLQSCISFLPIQWRQVFIDKMIERKDSEEVCKENDISSSNFWVIMHRSKLQLRECLEKKWFND